MKMWMKFKMMELIKGEKIFIKNENDEPIVYLDENELDVEGDVSGEVCNEVSDEVSIR